MESFIYAYYALLLGKPRFETALFYLFSRKEYEKVNEIIRTNVEKT